MKEICPNLGYLENRDKHRGECWISELPTCLCIYYLGPQHEGQAAGVCTASLSPLL